MSKTKTYDNMPKRSIGNREAVYRALELYGAENLGFLVSISYNPHTDCVVYTALTKRPKWVKPLLNFFLQLRRVKYELDYGINEIMDDVSRGPMRSVLRVEL